MPFTSTRRRFSLCTVVAAMAVGASVLAPAFAQTHQPPKDFSAIQKVELQNQLPGQPIPYVVRNDEGQRHLVGGMAVNVIARGEDTGKLYEMMTWTGGRDAGLPMHSLANAHEALYVMEGQVELWLGDAHHLLNRGDYASIPPGVPFAFTMRSHRTKLFNWSTGDGVVAAVTAMGSPYEGHVQPEDAKPGLTRAAKQAAEATGALRWLPSPKASPARPVTNTTLPNGVTPYVLAAGEGERYVAGDQVYTYLGDVRSSAGRFLAVMTEGPAGQMIPPHFHALHTEVFVPTEGSLTMIANAQTMVARPGDVVHLPAGTIHAYQLNDHYTQFLGFLTPGVFDDFFRSLGDAYTPHVYPQHPGPLRFDRILRKIDQLDLYLVGGKPPQAQ